MITEFTVRLAWNLFEIHFDDVATRTTCGSLPRTSLPLRKARPLPFSPLFFLSFPPFLFSPRRPPSSRSPRGRPLFAVARARFWNVKNFNVHLYVRGIVGDRWQRQHEYLSYGRICRNDSLDAPYPKKKERGGRRGGSSVLADFREAADAKWPGARGFRAVRDYRGLGVEPRAPGTAKPIHGSCIARPPK